jgi:allantoinase
MLVAVHAEDEALARLHVAEQHARGTDVRTWLASRPIELEKAAIRTAVDIAGETGCALHIVHVSSPEGVALARQARAQGLDVTVETCPHYLLLNEEDVVRLGAPAKCFPPLRPEAVRLGLWQALEDGLIDTVGSDHSPAPPSMKRSEDFFAIWGGVSGCQHAFELLITRSLERRPLEVALPHLSALLSGNVARRFRLDRCKGRIEVGLDADLTVLDLGSERTLSNAELLYRHRQVRSCAGARFMLRAGLHPARRGVNLSVHPRPPQPNPPTPCLHSSVTRARESRPAMRSSRPITT